MVYKPVMLEINEQEREWIAMRLGYLELMVRTKWAGNKKRPTRHLMEQTVKGVTWLKRYIQTGYAEDYFLETLNNGTDPTDNRRSGIHPLTSKRLKSNSYAEGINE